VKGGGSRKREEGRVAGEKGLKREERLGVRKRFGGRADVRVRANRVQGGGYVPIGVCKRHGGDVGIQGSIINVEPHACMPSLSLARHIPTRIKNRADPLVIIAL